MNTPPPSSGPDQPNSKSTSGRIVILSMSLIAIAFISGLIMFKTQIDQETPIAIDWGVRGLEFGEGKEESDCLNKAESEIVHCQEKMCRAQWGVFFSRCLENSAPLSGRCISVPELKEHVLSHTWKENYCQKFLKSSSQCLELAEWAQRLCLR